MSNNIPQTCFAQAYKFTGMKRLIQVSIGKTKRRWFKIGTPVFPLADRIGISQKVSFTTIPQYHTVSPYFTEPVNPCSSDTIGRGTAIYCGPIGNGKVKPFKKLTQVLINSFGIFYKIII